VDEHERRAVAGRGDVQARAVGENHVTVLDDDAVDLRERPRRHYRTRPHALHGTPRS